MGLIKFRTGKLSEFKAATIDNDTLYFITDTLQLYKGNQLFAKSFQVVDGFPTAGHEGVLYIDRTTKLVKTYNNGVWVDELDIKPVIADAVTVNGADAVSGKAVATYVQTAIDNITGGSNSTVVTSITAGDQFGTLKITQGATETTVSTNVGGAVVNPTYDAEGRVITLPVQGGDTLVINLGKDMVVKSGVYNADTNELELTLTDGSLVKIPVGKLIDIYTASADKTGAVSIEISNNQVKGSVIVDNTTIQIKDGKLVANFATLVTLEAFNALSGRVTLAETAIGELETAVASNLAAINEVKQGYLSKADAASNYATIDSVTKVQNDLTSEISAVD